MRKKDYERWVSRLEEFEVLHICNVTTIRELEEVMRIFHPSLLKELNSLNYWEKLRLIEFIVNVKRASIIAH